MIHFHSVSQDTPRTYFADLEVGLLRGALRSAMKAAGDSPEFIDRLIQDYHEAAGGKPKAAIETPDLSEDRCLYASGWKEPM